MFAWLAISVYEKTIGFKGSYADNIRTIYTNKGDRFQEDALCGQGYTYIFLEELRYAKVIKIDGNSTFVLLCILFVHNYSQ